MRHIPREFRLPQPCTLQPVGHAVEVLGKQPDFIPPLANVLRDTRIEVAARDGIRRLAKAADGPGDRAREQVGHDGADE